MLFAQPQCCAFFIDLLLVCITEAQTLTKVNKVCDNVLFLRYPSVSRDHGASSTAFAAQHHRVPLGPRQERLCVRTGNEPHMETVFDFVD